MGSAESRLRRSPNSFVAPTIIILIQRADEQRRRAEALRLEAAVEALAKND